MSNGNEALDRMIPPDAQRFMATRAGATVVEAPGSHSIYVSKPQAVASVVQRASVGVAVLTGEPR